MSDTAHDLTRVEQRALWFGAWSGLASVVPYALILLTVSVASGLRPSAGAAQELFVDSIGHDYGAADATVRVVEFSDFGCGYCRQFHRESFGSIHSEYVATGRVQWKYVTYVSGMFPNSREAALTAECVADQGLFAPMRDRLFEAQPEWEAESDPGPLFLGYALEVGADPDEVAKCLADGRTTDRVDQGNRLGRALGVRGTPTFVVDGFPMMGALPLDFMREVLDRRLAAAGAASPGAR